jgi:hypothetical protein
MEINLVLHDGTKLEGTYKNIYTGYYSEYNSESNYEFYFVGTLKSLLQNSGDSYKIELRGSMVHHDIIFNSGTDMPYISEPEYKGDLSPTREYYFTGLVNMDYWASDGIYLSFETQFGTVYTTSTTVDAEGYYKFSDFEIYFNYNYVYTDEFGDLVRIMEGTISLKHTIDSIIVHNTPSLSTSDKLHYLDFTQ